MTHLVANERSFEDVVNVYLLTECDMGCKFCYASKGLGRLTVDQARYVMDVLVREGAERVNLTGGEILMHPDALEIVRLASARGLAVTLFTSGSMYNEERVRSFSPSIRWLALSLDGDPATNVAMGRSEGHFQAALQALRATRRLAPQVHIRVATVVTSVNVRKLAPLAEILDCDDTRPDLWRIKQMVPTRRARRHLAELGTAPDEFAREAGGVVARFGSRLRIELIPATAKNADTMCVHPDGSATATLGDGADMRIHPLGNFFEDASSVFASWSSIRHRQNASTYARQWAARDGSDAFDL